MLSKPPIVITFFQIRFPKGTVPVSSFGKCDKRIREVFPMRKDNIQTQIQLHQGLILGKSDIVGTKDAKIIGYAYFSNDQRSKLFVGDDILTYQDEHPYNGWDFFMSPINKILGIYDEEFSAKEVERLSIRFVNRFLFDSFEDPTEYFRTLISTTEEQGFMFPLRNYGFRLILDIPNSDIHSIVNQNLDKLDIDKYQYIFDIDVIDDKKIIFNINEINSKARALSKIKNDIFFGNVTDKLLELCK